MDQTTDIILYSADKYTKSVFNKEFGYVDREALNHSRYQASGKDKSRKIDLFMPGCLCFILHRETVEPNGTYENTLSITPLLSENKEKRGLSLDGRLKDEDTNLASTTVYVFHQLHLIIARKFKQSGDQSSSCVCEFVSWLLIREIIALPLPHRLREGLEKDVLGILVSYKIKINLMVAGGG